MTQLVKYKRQDILVEEEIETVTELAGRAFVRAKKSSEKGERLGGQLIKAEPQDLMHTAPDEVSWNLIGQAEDEEPGSFVQIWGRIKQSARNELESGHRAAAAGVGVETPWNRARFQVLLESFIEDWKPAGSIELRLVEGMAQLWTQYEYWMQIATQRVGFECEMETYQVKERGKWRTVAVEKDKYIDRALENADRFNRLYLRTVRALRDLRRYSMAVTINNPEQVNIAADGGQQVNMQEKNKRKKGSGKGRLTKVKRRQLKQAQKV